MTIPIACRHLGGRLKRLNYRLQRLHNLVEAPGSQDRSLLLKEIAATRTEIAAVQQLLDACIANPPKPVEIVGRLPSGTVLPSVFALDTAINPLPAAVASVILLPGNNGFMQLEDQGGKARLNSNSQLKGNFVVRSAWAFLEAGLNVMMVDAPSETAWDTRSKRRTVAHATEIGSAIADARQRWKLPVWIVGTSNGTVSAVNAAVRLSGTERPDGIALTSAITRNPGNANPLANTVLASNPGVAEVQIPTIVAWHALDSCPSSPATSANEVMAALPPLLRVQVGPFTGGGWSLLAEADLCGGVAFHGFNGIEHTVASQVAASILALAV